jgi:hypothetical protein
MTPNKPSSPSFILSSPLAQRLDEGVSRHYRIRVERSRSQRHREGLKGEYGDEPENGDNNVAVEGEDDEWTGGKRKGGPEERRWRSASRALAQQEKIRVL